MQKLKTSETPTHYESSLEVSDEFDDGTRLAQVCKWVLGFYVVNGDLELLRNCTVLEAKGVID